MSSGPGGTDSDPFGTRPGSGTGDGPTSGDGPSGGSDGGDPIPDGWIRTPGPRPILVGGGDEQGDPIPEGNDPDAGASADPAPGGGDAPTDHSGEGPGDGDSPSGSSNAGQSGSSSQADEVDFSNDGTTFVAGGGDADQRPDGTARVENPDGSVDQVDGHGNNIYHSDDDSEYVDTTPAATRT